MNSPIVAINDYKMEYNTIENIPQHIFTTIPSIICLIIGMLLGMVIGYVIGKNNTSPSIIINNNGNQNIHQPLEPQPLHHEDVVADDEPVVADDEPVVLLNANVNNPWSEGEKRALLSAFDNKGDQTTITEVTRQFARQYKRECIEQGPAAARRRIPFYGQKCYTKLNSLRRDRGDFQVPRRRN